MPLAAIWWSLVGANAFTPSWPLGFVALLSVVLEWAVLGLTLGESTDRGALVFSTILANVVVWSVMCFTWVFPDFNQPLRGWSAEGIAEEFAAFQVVLSLVCMVGLKVLLYYWTFSKITKRRSMWRAIGLAMFSSTILVLAWLWCCSRISSSS